MHRIYVLWSHLFPKSDIINTSNNCNSEDTNILLDYNLYNSHHCKHQVFSIPLIKSPSVPFFPYCKLLNLKNIQFSNDSIASFETVMKTHPQLLKVEFQNSNLVKFRNEYIVLLPTIPSVTHVDDFDCSGELELYQKRSLQINLSKYNLIPDIIIWNIFLVYEPYLLQFRCTSSSNLIKQIQQQFSSWRIIPSTSCVLQFDPRSEIISVPF